MAPHLTRTRLCEAALKVATRDGLLSLTLDNVAKEAGISKGGVMYHFRTKDELLQAVLAHFGAQVEQMLLQKIAEDTQPRFRWARAMLSSVLTEATPDQPPVPPEANPPSGTAQPRSAQPGSAQSSLGVSPAGLSPDVIGKFLLATLAAVVNAPQVVQPLRDMGRRLQSRLLADPADGLDQLLIWVTVDGLFLWEFLGLISKSDPLYQQIVQELWRRVTMRSPAPTPTPSPAAGTDSVSRPARPPVSDPVRASSLSAQPSGRARPATAKRKPRAKSPPEPLVREELAAQAKRTPRTTSSSAKPVEAGESEPQADRPARRGRSPR